MSPGIKNPWPFGVLDSILRGVRSTTDYASGMRARQTASGAPNRRCWGGHAVKEVDPFDEESAELDKVHAMETRWLFGMKRDDPLFYVWFPNREARDDARAAFGPRCSNFGDASHSARDCPSPNTHSPI